MKFSVLMSIYNKEKEEYFNKAMVSIWDKQSLKPNEIILVQDGPLTDQLYKSINNWSEKIGSIFKIVVLKNNVGLGDALNIGLKECSYDIIARMDTDDICSQDRFKKQLYIFNTINIDICSSWVSEFDNNEDKIVSYRKVPECNSEIRSFSKMRSPINHPAVMYKKSAVIDAGGYKRMMWFEDYYLWARMILQGSRFYNIQEPLVNMRAGYGQLERRSGLKYAISEFIFQKKLYSIGFLNFIEFIKNSSIRFIARIIPRKLVKLMYKKIRD